MNRPLGFTIPELIITITVIGILATIGVVAYAGAQVNARNSQTIAAAQGYISAFPLYASSSGNGTMPGANGGWCLGRTSCRGDTWTNSASLDTQLQSVLGSTLPKPSKVPLADSGTNISLGVIVNSTSTTPAATVTVDGAIGQWVLFYTLEGANTSCGDVSNVLSGSWPAYTTTPPSGGYTSSTGGVTTCAVQLK